MILHSFGIYWHLRSVVTYTKSLELALLVQVVDSFESSLIGCGPVWSVKVPYFQLTVWQEVMTKLNQNGFPGK